MKEKKLPGTAVTEKEQAAGRALTELAGRALEARERAYAPYSGFAVGAAVVTEEGKVFCGCNIENASFSATNCAERTAIFKAVSEGYTRFAAIVIAGGPKGKEPEDFCVPCGVCLQVMSEFCPPHFPVYLAKTRTQIRRLRLEELLPVAFDGLETAGGRSMFDEEEKKCQ